MPSTVNVYASSAARAADATVTSPSAESGPIPRDTERNSTSDDYIGEDVQHDGASATNDAADAFLSVVMQDYHPQDVTPAEPQVLFFESMDRLKVWMKEEESRVGFHFNFTRSSPKINTRYYACHRAGTKKKHPERSKGGASGKHRPLQKESGKVQCMCTLRVKTLLSGAIEATYNPVHTNHRPGSLEDLAHLRKDEAAIARVKQLIEHGLDHHALSTHLLLSHNEVAQMSSQQSCRKNTFFTRDDLYNMVSIHIKSKYRKHEDELQSVEAWCDYLGAFCFIILYELRNSTC